MDTEIAHIASWTSILPALTAIILALATKRIIPSLIGGIFLGACLALPMSLGNVLVAAGDVIDTYILRAVVPKDGGTSAISIIVFSLLIGGMVGVIRNNGGTQGIVQSVARFAKDRRSGQQSSFFLGLAIFFDDYANTMVVGNAMRPITDALRISREKLAFIVDATAAPVASLFLVTTWIGFEVGLFDDALSEAGLNGLGYTTFLQAIPYSFYPILMLVFVGLVAFTGRDFGPMLSAERKTTHSTEEKTSSKEAKESTEDSIPSNVVNALLPIGILLLVTLLGLYITGSEGTSVSEVLNNADSLVALLWGSFASVIVAIAITVFRTAMTLSQAIEAAMAGIQGMLYAVVILVLAWALMGVNDALDTQSFLVSLLGDGASSWMLPSIVFVLASITAFSTGTSWGTMGVLVPLTVAAALGVSDGVDSTLFLACAASVLSGAVLGDHCSPISDTTILSSIATQCDHVEHVRTQLPYALVVGGVALVCGLLPSGFGIGFWFTLPFSVAVLTAVFFALSSKVEPE